MSKIKEKENISFLEIIIGVFAVIGFIFFIGELFQDKKESSKNEADKKQTNNLEKKQNRLIELEEYITKLSPQRDQLERTEKNIYLWSRIIIAIGLTTINLGFLLYSNWSFDMGNHLNLNGAIALVYSFFAFIIYGNPDTMVKAIRAKTAKLLQRKHIHILSELNEFEKERDVLVIQIKELEVLEKNNLLLIEQTV